VASIATLVTPHARSPLDEPLQIMREGRKRLHGLRIAVRRDGDIMRGRAAIDARDMGIDALEHGGGHARLAG
jgi:hypothetical protein